MCDALLHHESFLLLLFVVQNSLKRYREKLLLPLLWLVSVWKVAVISAAQHSLYSYCPRDYVFTQCSCLLFIIQPDENRHTMQPQLWPETSSPVSTDWCISASLILFSINPFLSLPTFQQRIKESTVDSSLWNWPSKRTCLFHYHLKREGFPSRHM